MADNGLRRSRVSGMGRWESFQCWGGQRREINGIHILWNHVVVLMMKDVHGSDGRGEERGEEYLGRDSAHRALDWGKTS